MFDIQYELSLVPAMPGIYIMKDKNESVIYVGKAKLLKNRLKQYFTNSKNISGKSKFMVSQISSFEFIVASSEAEALILERNLIKKHKPKFNVLLKDDKNYPMIKVTLYEDYPRVFMTRRVEKDGSKYFGPYTNASAVRETLDYLSKIYPLRNCSKSFPRDMNKQRPCINYQIGRCLAPCQGWISKKGYNLIINDVCKVLEGKINKILASFKEEMTKQSEKLNFEKAKEYRDRINALNNIAKKQNVSLKRSENGDFIACYGNDKKQCVQIFYLRGSNITGRSSHNVKLPFEKTKKEIISEFISQYYDKSRIIPSKIYVQDISDEKESLEGYLSGQCDHGVRIIKPQKGEKKKIIDLAKENARIEFTKNPNQIELDESFLEDAFLMLEKYLLIKNIKRVEAVDVSNTAKHDIVAAAISLDKTGFDKNRYRRYMIKGDYGINDYMSMAEVIKRRFGHDSINSDDIPDILFVDGGQGHVSTIKKAVNETGFDLNVIGMVKDEKHKTKGIFFEGEYFDIHDEPVVLKIITMIQNETHRFALKYNKEKRKKRMLSSELDVISGVGEKRKNQLLNKFGSVKKIKEADAVQISEIPGISIKLAEKIKESLG